MNILPSQIEAQLKTLATLQESVRKVPPPLEAREFTWSNEASSWWYSLCLMCLEIHRPRGDCC